MMMMKESEKCLDSQFWHACAGGMVQMPAVNTKVYYFPQGHVEHAQGQVVFESTVRVPPHTLCRVAAVKYMADAESDEVFATIRLVPVGPGEADYGDDDGLSLNSSDAKEKPDMFAKTLTQSDANNGGGFSVPRYCAETIFPRLDYKADPPVQIVLAKDVQGKIWKFRHIYRGTPRRHLLTTGWSNFVNQKKLVAGDSIVFLRTENGDLCVGIRRAKRAVIGVPDSPSKWNHPAVSPYGGFSVFLREEENKMMKSNGGSGGINSGSNMRGRVTPESVTEAATKAATGQPFEVVYYPRASTPEFCVKAVTVRTAMRINWCSGMRFKMPFETEDSSRISWFMGTISSVQVADPIRWPSSPWRLLQVTWDEPDLLQNVKCVSPWLVQLVSSITSIPLEPFYPPRKKLRIPPFPDFPMDVPFPYPAFSGNPLGPSSNPFCCLPDSTPAGIQGARHAQFGISLSDQHLNHLQSGLFQAGLYSLDRIPPPRITSGLIIGNPSSDSNVSCLLTIGNPSHNTQKLCNEKPHFVLFGQPILTEEQMSQSSYEGPVSPGVTGNRSSDENPEKTAKDLDGYGSVTHPNGVVENSSYNQFPWYKDRIATDLGLENGHCKVFMESEDVGRTLDLTVVSSYDELYRRLADMFGIDKLEMMSHVLYRDAEGAVKHTGDESFSEFTKTARRLTIPAVAAATT